MRTDGRHSAVSTQSCTVNSNWNRILVGCEAKCSSAQRVVTSLPLSVPPCLAGYVVDFAADALSATREAYRNVLAWGITAVVPHLVLHALPNLLRQGLRLKGHTMADDGLSLSAESSLGTGAPGLQAQPQLQQMTVQQLNQQQVGYAMAKMHDKGAAAAAGGGVVSAECATSQCSMPWHSDAPTVSEQAFSLYQKDHQEQVMKEGSNGGGMVEADHKLNSMWQAASDKEKAAYERLAVASRDSYQKEVELQFSKASQQSW